MLIEKLRVLLKIFKSEEGQSMIEYSLILTLIAMVVFGSLSGVADVVDDVYNNKIWSAISNALGP